MPQFQCPLYFGAGKKDNISKYTFLFFVSDDDFKTKGNFYLYLSFGTRI